jgi:TolB-like protein/lipoprotein NlpI
VLVDGEPAKIGARAFDLLMVLLENRDRVIGKEELLAAVWPGRVVEEGNLAVHVLALRRVFGAHAISTAAGRGYRFTLEPAPAQPSAEPRSPPDKPSIAVLPFANLGDDPDQDVFADGIAEDILTELSRFRELFVIARNSSFTYRGRTTDVRTIGRQLGVRYLLEGSVRRAGERVRVTAQLIDALDGGHVWAERYDRVLDDLFGVQLEVTASIVASIAPQIAFAEIDRLRKTGSRSLGAYELAVRARAAAHDAHVGADVGLLDRAAQYASQALELEPDNLTALEVLALAATMRLQFDAAADPAATLEEGLSAVARGLAIDAGWAAGHAYRGMLLMMSRKPDLEVEALSALRRAHELNPNNTYALFALGFGELAAGRDARAVACFQRALHLSPRDPGAYNYHAALALGRIALGEFDAALEAAKSAVDAAPRYPVGRCMMAIAYGALGQDELSRASLEAARALSPDYVRRLIDDRSIVHRNPRLKLRGLRYLRLAAGLPDPRAGG